MQKLNKNKIKIKKFILPLFSFILIFIILLKFVEIKEFLNIIKKIKWKWFFVAFIFQIFSIFFSTLFKYELLENLKEKISLWFLTKVSTAMIFIDIAIPSQSISSFIFLFKVLGKKGIEKGKRAILILNNFFIQYIITFFLLLFASLYSFIFKYNLLGSITLIFLCFFLSIILILFILFLKFDKSEKIIINISQKIQIKFLNKFIKNFEIRFIKLIKSYYKERKKYKINYKRAVLLNFLENFCRILSLFFVIFALNYKLTLDKVIIIYLFASLIALISYIKLGFFDAGLTVALVGFGINYSLAFATMIVFRIINLWIPLILGYLATRKILKEVEIAK